MRAGALATLEQVNGWLGITSQDDDTDTLLNRLIDSASRFVLSYTQLDTFARKQYGEMYDGYGQSFMLLRQAPALSVLAVSANGVAIPVATGDGITNPYVNGFALFDQKIQLFGRIFPRCRSSVFVTYTAGYYIEEESHVIPSGTPYEVTVNNPWLDDGPVTIGTETLIKVDATPGDMEYSVSGDTYTFNVGQAGDTALISYSYVPADVNQAVVELVGERYKYRDRIGHASKSLAGQEVVSFTGNNVPMHVKELLNKYLRVVPI